MRSPAPPSPAGTAEPDLPGGLEVLFFRPCRDFVLTARRVPSTEVLGYHLSSLRDFATIPSGIGLGNLCSNSGSGPNFESLQRIHPYPLRLGNPFAYRIVVLISNRLYFETETIFYAEWIQ